MLQADLEIKQTLQSNVHKAFELLYEHYFSDLCVYALRFFDNSDDAQEIVQQTLIKMWEQHEKLQKVEHLRTYLFRSIHNASLNLLRNKKRQTQTADEQFLHDLQWEFTDELVSREECQEIELAIAQLPTQCRTVFDLNRLQGLSYKEIAEKLNISHRTVDSHLSQATRLLRQKLKSFAPAAAFGLLILLSIKR